MIGVAVREARPARVEACPILVAAEEGSGRPLGSVTSVPGPGTSWSELERLTR